MKWKMKLKCLGAIVKMNKKIEEAINNLQTFLECDMYTKFRPEVKIGKEKMYREDFFKSEKEFEEYLTAHFDILKKEIEKIK